MTVRADRVRCLPLAEWPSVDREAFEAALRPGGLLLEDGAGAQLRPNTLRRHRKGYGRFLSWLADTQPEIPIGPPSPSSAPQATKEVVERYAAALRRTNASGTVLERLSSLYVVLRWIAPDRNWSWFVPLLRRLEARAVGVTDKRLRLRRADELLELGEAMMAAAEDPRQRVGQRDHPHDRARLYRDGLMIAFLAMRPLRLANLIGMEVGRHLVRCGDRWWIEIAGEEMKTGTPLEIPFPDRLTAALQRYLTYWRPRLAPPGMAELSFALWLSDQGRAMSRSRTNTMINRRTAAAFGLPVNPHLFRDALATTIAVHRPEEVHIVSRLLGHNAIATVERFYNQARQVDAARHWHACLESYGGQRRPLKCL
jgi:integrase/recombinase XerD